VVLWLDEKSRIQALDRTQPLLPMRPGQAERRTHDYARHGTLSLFTALDAATGKVVGRCFARHRAREFRTFLNTVEANVPDDLDVHIVIEAQRPRWHVHYSPTSASWLNPVERFFANLTEKQIRRGVHRSTAELEAAINTYNETVNANPRPFVWTKSADDILATIKRFCLATLKSLKPKL
jgi:transposase